MDFGSLLRRLTGPWALVCLTSACATTPKANSAPELRHPSVPEASDNEGDIAPRPYTAAEIREGNPSGRSVVYRMERQGEPPVIQEVTFVDSREDGTLVHDVVRTLEGRLVSEDRARATWDELMRHATFPAGQTTIEVAVAETPAGRFPCKLYTVRREDGINRFWFADAMPGAPVRYEMEVGGELVMSATLLEERKAGDEGLLHFQPPVADAAKVGLGFFSHEGRGDRRNHVHGDDFEVLEAAVVEGVRFWGLTDATQSSGLDNVSAFVVRIHRLEAAGPGPIVVEQRFSTAATRPEPTGRHGSGQGEATRGGAEYRHEATFDRAVELAAGRYVLSIAAVRIRPDGDNWQWQDGITRAGLSWSRPLDGADWQRMQDTDSAFAILGRKHAPPAE